MNDSLFVTNAVCHLCKTNLDPAGADGYFWLDASAPEYLSISAQCKNAMLCNERQAARNDDDG